MKRSRTGKLDIHAVLMRLVCVLLMMVLVTTGIVSGQLARYITSAAGTDYARVAEFDITQTGTLTESFTLPIAPGGSIQRAVTVRNSSEVAVNYRIAVSNPEDNLPLEFSAVDSGNTPLTLTGSGNAVELAGSLAQGGDSETYTLTIRWKDGYTDDFYAGKVDLIRITLIAEQAD